MNNKKTIFITIVILIGSLVIFAFIQKEIQLNNETSSQYLMEPGINIRGQIKHASEINEYSDYSNNNFMPEYAVSNDLIEIKNKGASYFPSLESKYYFLALPEHKNLFHTSYMQTSYTVSLNNFSVVTKTNSNNHNCFSQSISYNEQPLALLKLNSKREKNVSQTKSQENLNQQHNGFYGSDAEFHFTINKPLENNYSIQNVIVDPGDPPDGNPIPVQDGTYFLIFLITLYGVWKILLYQKNN